MSNNKIVVDSNILIGFYLSTDALHSQAKSVIKETKDIPKAINNYLLSEITTLILLRGKNLPLATRVAQDFIKDTFPKFNLVKTNSKLNQITLDIFQNQKTNQLSFTDCSLIATARMEKIKIIATFDKDLRKEFKHEFQFLPKDF